MFLLSSWAFEREIIEVERCDHLLARLFLANLLRFVAENYEFATHTLGGSENCGFATMEQCLAQVRGLGGWCRPNPYPGTAFGTGGTWSSPPRQYRGGH